jgi:hypothetical protein
LEAPIRHLVTEEDEIFSAAAGLYATREHVACINHVVQEAALTALRGGSGCHRRRTWEI